MEPYSIRIYSARMSGFHTWMVRLEEDSISIYVEARSEEEAVEKARNEQARNNR